MKTQRDLKVYAMSGYQYKPTPTIQLKGEWLREFGFDAGREYTVSCETDRLVIQAKEMPPEPDEAPRAKGRKVRR